MGDTMTQTLRDTITNAYRMDETTCLQELLPLASFSETEKARILDAAAQLVVKTREYKKKQSKIDTLLHQYDLTTDEGIALMCLAEALLRIPDKATVDRFISDKLSSVDWKNHVNSGNPLFVNMATWSLALTGKVYAPTIDNQKGLFNSLKRATSQLGASMIRPAIMQMMKAIGNQFVTGETISAALNHAESLEKMGYRFSYDMLGEAARTAEDAKRYLASYSEAIDAIGQKATLGSPSTNPGISIKLSALHPRYEFAQRERVMKELPPLLLTLAQQAKKYNIGFTIDAEEADRLDLSLDIIETVFSDPSLAGWEGFGLAVQAYQKRAPFVIDWLAELAKQHSRRIMVRLVKGAYWDAEIKVSQIQGFSGYPVFTRKNATDVSYLACAKKLFANIAYFYPQFGTHNAYSAAAILEMGMNLPSNAFEFQCLHGMGRSLYDHVVDETTWNRPVRIYAPVGTHKDLLGYLVRRLLENGANSSFVNQLADDKTPMDKIVFDPVARIEALECKPHPYIPLPSHIYPDRINSQGVDFSNRHIQNAFLQQMHAAENKPVNGLTRATEADVEKALTKASAAQQSWAAVPVSERAAILERAADLYQHAMPSLAALLSNEGGKCLFDCIGEIRETIDFCRYYANRARLDLQPVDLPGPTGESNQLSLHPRGTIACISPWNFPLAIFTGQIVAALAAGNTVLAKPAEQTPLVALKSVQILHEAGIPTDVLQLIIGSGRVVGAALTKDPRVAGIMFTGSTQTAKFIEQSLANRTGPIALFIAETGGQNAMIVDSSALPEQAVIDIAQSAFNSAGQRCSALRVLFVQEDIAPTILTMLKGYMAELTIGDPQLLSTDIGPVIDKEAQAMLQQHADKMNQTATLIAEVPMPPGLSGSYFAPRVFELKDLSQLEGEVFGPILHVIRYASSDLDKVMDAIMATGYGLTLGIHSRIDATIQYITSRMPVGNMYVNRNMIGAVVGVQPFGGERLSGTGPKAGGPHYLPRLCVERTVSTNTTAVGGNARLVSLREDGE
jgi:RHH-type proline utilization regulon transcriptional repressor/proline dehydrogenase/delta 1-pyrroline-5-carboxylate dehydrogenase